MIRPLFLAAALVFGLPLKAAAAPMLPLEQVVLDEAELRLLLARRNLERAYAKAAGEMKAGFRADALRVRQRYLRLSEPLRASERRSRLAAMRRLDTFASLHTDATQRTGALLRLAALQMEEADDEYEARMTAYFDALETGEEPAEPQKDFGIALTTLRRLLGEGAKGTERDTAWYLIGYAKHEMGDDEGARGAFARLLEEAPPGELRSEVLVRVGDYYFDRSRTEEAMAFYREAMRDPGAWYDRAMYKWAWSLYKLNRYSEAVSVFTQLADLGAKRPDLQAEALQYLAISYVEGYGYMRAVSDMTARGPRPYDQELLTRVADVLYDSTDYGSAVTAYAAAIERRALAPEALSLAKRKILSYHQMRDVDGAVAARLDFVRMFEPRGAWYQAQVTRPALRAEADRWSERALYEYATYHHYRELRDRPESRPLAEEAYRMYLARFPGKPRAVQMGFYLAEILYDRDEYAAALSYYTRVTLSAPDPATDIASRSAYNMVLAAREMFRHDPSKLDVLLETSRKFAELRPADERTPLVVYHAAKLHCQHHSPEKCRDELSRLLELYPQSDLAVDAVRTVIHSYVVENKYGELAAWADRLLARGRIVDPETRSFVIDMVGGAMFRDALSKDQAGAGDQAAEQYLAVYKRYPQTPAGQAALYNAAFSLERAGRFLAALREYERLLTQHPQAEFAARAAFRRARIFENAANFPAALTSYTQVFTRYPRAAESQESLFNVGAIHARLGDHAMAAAWFERHYATYGAASTRTSDTLLRAAAQWELAGNTARARELFLQYAQLPVITATTGYASYRAAMLSSGKERVRLLGRGLKYYSQATGAVDPGVTAALRFELAELDRATYLSSGLPPDLKKAAKALNNKAIQLKQLQAAYTKVVEAGDPEYAVAALYRIGEAYAAFADMLYNAPVPKGLSEEEADIYKVELEGQAAPVEDKALEAFKKAEARGKKNGQENRWTALVRRSLYDKPNPVSVVTARLEPLFVPARRGIKPPAELAMREEELSAPKPAALFAADDLDVSARRLRGLLQESIGKQRIFFHADRPYVDRLHFDEEANP